MLVLEKEAREAAAVGRFDRAVVAATDAKLALDSDILSNVNMMVRWSGLGVTHRLRVWVGGWHSGRE